MGRWLGGSGAKRGFWIRSRLVESLELEEKMEKEGGQMRRGAGSHWLDMDEFLQWHSKFPLVKTEMLDVY